MPSRIHMKVTASTTYRDARRLTLFMCIIGVCIALLCEFFVFNLPYWQTKSLHTRTVSAPVLGSGVVREKNGELRITSTHNSYVEVQSDETNDPIQYIRLDDVHHAATTYLVAYDIVTKQPSDLGWYSGGMQRHISSADSRSRLIHIDKHAQGVRIEFKNDIGTIIPVAGVTINPHIRFSISKLRLSLEILLALFITLFRPGSLLYKIPLRHSNGQTAMLLTMVFIQLAMVCGICGQSSGGRMRFEGLTIMAVRTG